MAVIVANGLDRNFLNDCCGLAAQRPDDNAHYVNGKGTLSLSLPQAVLVDFKLPIKIAEGE